MKKYKLKGIHLLVLLLITLFNCKNESVLRTDLQPVYSDFENSLQGKNLYGKVKKIEYYKTTLQNSEIDSKAVINKIEEYTDFGELKKAEYFDDFGELLQTNSIEYNENQDFVKSLSISKSRNTKILQISRYDSIQNIRENIVFINDTIHHKSISFFGKGDFPERQIAIEKNDTIEVVYQYKFDEKGKMEFASQKEADNENSRISYSYKYDNNGNKIESLTKSRWIETISIIEWENERLKKQTTYTISADSVKHLNNITEFDILYNQINSKEFEDSKLSRELKFKYVYDKNGNWIEKSVSMKEHSANSKDFIPIYIDTRKISYWE